MPSLIVICHNIRSLHNIGSIFRTSDAAGVDKIYLGGYSGCPPRNEISKTALGAENYMQWEYNFNTWQTIENLKKQGTRIVALEQSAESKPIWKHNPKFPMALVIGNEVRGISKKIISRCDDVVSIPMYGKKESLNVSVAFGIAIYIIKFKYHGKSKKTKKT